MSLIFSVENKFKPYANTCLFRVMDYLTDTDPLMRKLSINIVYTLVFYCKEEILEVKDNIIEFLNVLKEDENKDIKDICKKILEFIQDDSNNDNINTKNTKTKKDSNIKILNNSGKKPDKNPQEKNKNNIINNYTNNKEVEELDSKIDIILNEINKIKQAQERFQIELDNLVI